MSYLGMHIEHAFSRVLINKPRKRVELQSSSLYRSLSVACHLDAFINKLEQYPWVVLYLLIKAATRQATKTRDDQ